MKTRLKVILVCLRMGSAILSLLVGQQSPADQAAPELPPPAAKKVDFKQDIQPLFEQRCLRCHGDQKQESSFRLDNPQSAQLGGDLGPAYVAGDSAHSALVHYIAGADPNIVMPPADSQLASLSHEEVGLVRAWIDQGAVWPLETGATKIEISKKKDPQNHWSFKPPQRAEIPDVRESNWPKNPIDYFILSRLEEAGLAPAVQADRKTLIRRLSLDLTGLPPTPEEVSAFVTDHSEGAYDNLVERLLESPHYGERWALWWLDIARYADTNGYEIDRPRSIWPYRDWVISAFNSQMPFDQFVIEQMAGDLVPNATLSQRIATGFHRNTFLNEEGGHDAEQFRWEAVVDRASTTGTAFLGLTMGCAQCHNHKYDPISQAEFYEFFAFLNSADEPEVEVPQAEIAATQRTILAEIEVLEAKRAEEFPLRESSSESEGVNIAKKRRAKLEESFEAWRDDAAALAREWLLLEPVKWDSKNGQTLTKLADHSLLASGDRPEVDTYEVEYRCPPGKITGIRLEAMPDISLPNEGPGRGYYADDGTFLLSEFSVRTAHPVALKNPSATINKNKKSNIGKAIDGEKLTGWHIAGGVGKRICAVFEVAEPFIGTSNETLNVTLLQNFVHSQTIGRFRIWVTGDESPLVATEMPPEIEQSLLKPFDTWTISEAEAAKRYYLSVAKELKEQNRKIEKLRESLTRHPRTLVLQEREIPRVTHQHIRGDFRRPGPRVSPNVPRFLHPLPDGPRNRLTLAKWLVDRRNPLIGRVIMNQIWQCYFGKGFVATPEDFGTEGAPPSHPKLLDWLACEFVDNDWSLRHIHRLIVTSAAYQQSSATSSEKMLIDPENTLISRGARFRLHAELIRDAVLQASGQLNPTIGGPSVFPLQPKGVTELSFSKFVWPTSTDLNRFRRGLYTFRKRSAMYAAYSMFDAPPQNTCSMRRIRSNTPLQGLALLNDAAMIEAAQALAKLLIEEKPVSDRVSLDLAMQRCVSRSASETEAAALIDFLAIQRKRFENDLEAARLVAGVEKSEGSDRNAVVERASWTLVVRVLLNLDETISKE